MKQTTGTLETNIFDEQIVVTEEAFDPTHKTMYDGKAIKAIGCEKRSILQVRGVKAWNMLTI